jgi:hypothetical protein
MRRLISGVVLGLVLGGAGSALGFRPVEQVLRATLVGTGYLYGWEVTLVVNGVEYHACDDPYVWAGTREIECEAE